MPTLTAPKSKKVKKLVVLPGEYMSRVVIPTRLVNAEYSYTLIQERIFNYVMHYLHYYIKQAEEGKEIHQLDLFKSNSERINISIPLMTIAKPAYYDRAREAAKELATIMVRIPMENKERIRGLFEWVDIPDENRRQRSGILHVAMAKQVADMFLEMYRNGGIPSEYTAFMFEVTMLCKNKYTPRFYKMLCSWKRKGKCYMTIDELKTWLQLGSKYKTYAGIKQHILEPVFKELKKFADVWFDIAHPEFESKEGTKVVGLCFRIETPELSLHYVKLRISVSEMLERHFKLSQADLKKLEPMLNDVKDFGALQYKIMDLAERIRTDRTINHVPSYVVKSLLNYHKPR